MTEYVDRAEETEKSVMQIREENLKKSREKMAEEVPPTALPADVYLTKLEALLKENARLQSMIGNVVGQCHSVLTGTACLIMEGTDIPSGYVETVIDPLIEWLKTIKV